MRISDNSLVEKSIDVSVVVPNYNTEERFLRKSFISLANQSFTSFECIVVDDSDNLYLAELCQSLCKNDPRFVYIRNHKRLGLAASLNVGIARAKGRFIARFDSDDICTVDRIEVQKRYLEEHVDIGVVGSWVQIIDGVGEGLRVRKYSETHSDIENDFIYKNAMAHPTVMFRNCFDNRQIYFYREDFRCAEDLELWLRLLKQGVKFGNVPTCLVLYRQTTTDRSIGNWKFNVRARLNHLSRPKFILKFIVILLLVIWGYIPKVFQRFIYSVAILSK